jgi:hypothetical protein
MSVTDGLDFGERAIFMTIFLNSPRVIEHDQSQKQWSNTKNYEK